MCRQGKNRVLLCCAGVGEELGWRSFRTRAGTHGKVNVVAHCHFGLVLFKGLGAQSVGALTNGSGESILSWERNPGSGAVGAVNKIRVPGCKKGKAHGFNPSGCGPGRDTR